MNGLSDISAPLIRPRFFSTLLRCGNGQQSRSRAVATQAETSYFFYLNPLAVFYHLVISYLVSPSIWRKQMETKAVFGETCASLVQASKGGKACLGSLEPREIRDCESL